MADKKSSATQKGNSAAQPTQEQAQNPEFVIQRLYIKDSSFEAPNAPLIFQEKWEPKVHLDLHNQSSALAEHVHEVVLGVTVTVKLGEKTAFLVEIKQGGVFTIRGFIDDQLKQVLGSFCPNVLFPYAREAISDLIVRGGFPALYLAPINFDALYHEHVKSQQQQAASDSPPTQ